MLSFDIQRRLAESSVSTYTHSFYVRQSSQHRQSSCSVQHTAQLLACVGWIGGCRRSRYSRQNFTVIRYDHLAGYCHRTAELLLYLEEQLQDTTRGLRTPSVIGGSMASQYLEIPGL